MDFDFRPPTHSLSQAQIDATLAEILEALTALKEHSRINGNCPEIFGVVAIASHLVSALQGSPFCVQVLEGETAALRENVEELKTMTAKTSPAESSNSCWQPISKLGQFVKSILVRDN